MEKAQKKADYNHAMKKSEGRCDSLLNATKAANTDQLAKSLYYSDDGFYDVIGALRDSTGAPAYPDDKVFDLLTHGCDVDGNVNPLKAHFLDNNEMWFELMHNKKLYLAEYELHSAKVKLEEIKADIFVAENFRHKAESSKEMYPDLFYDVASSVNVKKAYGLVLIARYKNFISIYDAANKTIHGKDGKYDVTNRFDVTTVASWSDEYDDVIDILYGKKGESLLNNAKGRVEQLERRVKRYRGEY